MMRLFMLAVVLALGVSLASADTYWVSWEGDAWPEDQGWERTWGDWEGQYHGSGAVRTLEDGVLTYDSRYDLGVCDFYEMQRPGQIDPDPGELFVMEWRLKVDEVVGWRQDPGVYVAGDGAPNGWCLGLGFGWDCIYSGFEYGVTIPFTPGIFHDYRVTSSDMRSYDLFIDGELARHGAFAWLLGLSEVTWGDGVQGAGSLHHWDYFRFGVTPEPTCLWLLATAGLWAFHRRR